MFVIAQITDFHLGLPGSRADERYRTAEHLARAVAHLNALEPRPDVVLATGDLTDDGTAAEYARLKELLVPLVMPVFLIPGNHDDREALRAAFPDRLPAQGFLHYAVEDYPVRLLALDTNVPGAGGGLICEERAEWLSERLAEQPERPTVLFMHHPPFRTGMQAMDRMGLEGAERLERTVAPYENVERVLCGHLHRPIQRRFAGTIASTCPGTAHQLALDLVSGGKISTLMGAPACQLHVWYGHEDGLVTHTSYIGVEHGQRTVVGG
jgi:3',5'-cyclic AMP phosphodiesterase CpdA